MIDSAREEIILDMVDKVKETYQGKEWKKGLQMMAKVKEETNIEKKVEYKWIPFFEELS
jgi:hypothetical protein